MLAEISIGRNTQKNVVGAFRRLNRRWTFLGGIGVITLFVILSYYCVVGGWVLKYIQVYLTGADFGTGATPYQDYFVNFISKPVEPLLWGAVFLALCVYVVVRGVSKGCLLYTSMRKAAKAPRLQTPVCAGSRTEIPK